MFVQLRTKIITAQKQRPYLLKQTFFYRPIEESTPGALNIDTKDRRWLYTCWCNVSKKNLMLKIKSFKNYLLK